MPEVLPIAGWLNGRAGQTVQLLPGQLCFGDQAACVRTLLGSCVGITLWHPLRRLGGMCHVLLPSRRPLHARPDARFADEAIECLVEAIDRAGTAPAQYRTGLYGGADTMPDRVGVKLNVGQRNIEAAYLLLDRHGFELAEVDVGDQVPRHLELHLQSGHVALRRGRAPADRPEVAPPRRAA